MTSLRALRTVLQMVCLPMVAVGMGWLIADAVSRGKDVRSRGRFSQMEVALLSYHQEHGVFPPTKYQPVAGGPIHSWRVLILPYTSPGLIERYATYDFSQEWNSSANLSALGRMAPDFFRIAGEGSSTHYIAVGDADEWPSRRPLRSRLITKGKDRFLLVEYPEADIHWMEPKY